MAIVIGCEMAEWDRVRLRADQPTSFLIPFSKLPESSFHRLAWICGKYWETVLKWHALTALELLVFPRISTEIALVMAPIVDGMLGQPV